MALIHYMNEDYKSGALTRDTKVTWMGLSFQDKRLGRKGKDTHINLLELEMVWKVFQKFDGEIRKG